MTQAFDIPGRHERTCPSCGVRVTLDEGMSVAVSAGRRVVAHTARCPACGSPLRYTVPIGHEGATTSDVPEGWLARLAARLKRRNA